MDTLKLLIFAELIQHNVSNFSNFGNQFTPFNIRSPYLGTQFTPFNFRSPYLGTQFAPFNFRPSPNFGAQFAPFNFSPLGGEI